MNRFIYLFALIFITSCGSSQSLTDNDAPLPEDPSLQATLWVQNSAEYKALNVQAYETAERMLSLPLEDSFWTASVNQKDESVYRKLPPAIIMDIDETVLDNSPFQARMILENKSYNSDDWNAWCLEANAEAVPGAVEFAQYANEQGVTIFYLSNRSYEVEEATRKNLKELGFPVSTSMDNILTNGEQPNWTSSKVNRRKMVEDSYRVIMLFGDDLNDFFPAKEISQAERDNKIREYSANFGRKWFILPNPIYGSWDSVMRSEMENENSNAGLDPAKN
ncbi:5'-nucleotidase, lipoprotein e(P4) family [Gracilimonas amylolytica]|uniref:5'-nucleotidase, lipoprotein e(P4) family n=1 Tax=Gracilimonas amylolytica TaxID=1749045 RepID=UPI000CD98669|nr:5'-nucleotidase, lipoprotein e(P4) family [Gracilimonas amylolytica]